jgi:hypothetical protein
MYQRSDSCATRLGGFMKQLAIALLFLTGWNLLILVMLLVLSGH